MENNRINTGNRNQTFARQEINIREAFNFIWRLKYWILLSVIVAVSIAFIYTRMLTPVYERTIWVMLNRNNEKDTELYLLPEFANQPSKKNENELFSEVFIIKSPTTISKVVEELGINTRYFKYTNPISGKQISPGILNTKKEEYYNNSPFELTVGSNPLYPDNMQPKSVELCFKNINGNTFRITGLSVDGKTVKDAENTYTYGDSILMGSFSLKLTASPSGMADRGKYKCVWKSPACTAQALVSNLQANVQGRSKTQSDIIVVSYKDNIPQRAEDILNNLIRTVNECNREYKNKAVQNTLSFIDQRLAIISSELGEAENKYKDYRTNRVAVALESQTEMTVKGDMDLQKQLTEVELQLRILDMISDYLAQETPGEYNVIPANVGISDAGLNGIINSYNSLVTDRNRMVASSSESNPRVLSANHQLEDSRKAIELSVSNLRNVYGIREKELKRAISNSQRKMAEIPQQQYELQQLSRKMEVIEPLVQLLQQKREETQMIMYSSVDNLRVIQNAFGTSYPVYPNNKMILLFAFFLGCCIPPAVIWLKGTFSNKVANKKDIEDKIKAPLIAIIPQNQDIGSVLIPQNGRDMTSESFRMLRSNIQYLEGVKVIQVTSSIFGEGKSYIASNLALSIAHTGRKVILVGMDLRKPAIHKYFSSIKPKRKNNVVGLLTGRCTRIEFAIQSSEVCDNLDLMTTGSVPPNPTELLSFDKQKDIIERLRDKYDYVIIDSAPYLQASDSLLINSYVDATLYVVRAGYTDKRLFDDINDAIHSKYKPIQNTYIVLNGLYTGTNIFRNDYDSLCGYGYGYNYGYGSDSE